MGPRARLQEPVSDKVSCLGVSWGISNMLCLLYVMIIVNYGGISGEARRAAFLILDIRVVSVECFGGIKAQYPYSL